MPHAAAFDSDLDACPAAARRTRGRQLLSAFTMARGHSHRFELADAAKFVPKAAAKRVTSINPFGVRVGQR